MPCVVAQACNPSTQEAEIGGLRFQAQPGLQSETKQTRKQTNKQKILM
jgi:hypothetical protein